MSDGHGSTPDTPPGWAPNQPPPYGDAPGSPWTAPGAGPGTPPAPPPPPPQSPPRRPQDEQPPPPYQHHPHSPYGPYGGQPPYGYRPQPPVLRPGIIPLRPLGLGDILDGAIKLIRSNPKAVLGLSAIAAALSAIPVAIGQAITLGRMGTVLSRDPAALEGSPPQVGFLAEYGAPLASYAVQFVAVTMLTGVLTRILGRAVFGGRMTVGEAWRLTRGRVPALFGVVLAQVLLLLIPLAVAVGVIYTLVTVGADIGVVVGVGVLLTLALLAYSLSVATVLALAAPATVLERRGAIASLSRSWHLVKGGFWRTLGIWLLTQIIAILVAMVLSIPFTIAGGVVGVLGQETVGSQIGAAVLIAIGGTIAAMITYPFQAGVNGLLYADRRMRAEAFDLVLQTAAIEQQRQGWVHATADDLWDPSATPGGPGRGAPWSGS